LTGDLCAAARSGPGRAIGFSDGAAQRTLDGEDRRGIVRRQGKGAARVLSLPRASRSIVPPVSGGTMRSGAETKLRRRAPDWRAPPLPPARGTEGANKVFAKVRNSARTDKSFKKNGLG